MNYFELFELPVSFMVNTKQLNENYFRLQMQYHPDFYSNATDDEKEEALEMSSLINRAFKTLENEDTRTEYILELKDLITEGEKYELPPDFLMEMMELNEELTEADPSSIRQTEQKIGAIEEQLYNEVKHVMDTYSEHQPKEALLPVKEYFFKKKYLERVRERIDGTNDAL
jgi:molecular chaperone HscB